MPSPSPAEILQRRIELHESRGEKLAAARLADELREAPTWALEQLEAGDRPADAISDDPLGWSLQQLGLSMTLCGHFERYGVLWVRDLTAWTEDRLRLAPRLRGPATRRLVRQALARVGLSLRAPAPGEPPERLPPARPLARRRSYFDAISPAKTRIVIKLLATGVSQRNINAALGYAAGAHWAAWRVNQRLKQMLSAGKTPTQTAEELGIDSRSACWDEVVAYLDRLGKKWALDPAPSGERQPQTPDATDV